VILHKTVTKLVFIHLPPLVLHGHGGLASCLGQNELFSTLHMLPLRSSDYAKILLLFLHDCSISLSTFKKYSSLKSRRIFFVFNCAPLPPILVACGVCLYIYPCLLGTGKCPHYSFIADKQRLDYILLLVIPNIYLSCLFKGLLGSKVLANLCFRVGLIN